MFGQKGQESAPFELLIAVIVMAFVLMVGLTAMDTLQKEKCRGEIESEMEEFKTNLQTTASGRGTTSFGLAIPQCSKDWTLKIFDRASSQICSAYCGGTRYQCTLLLYSNSESVTKCLNISPNTVFPTQESTCNPSDVAEGYTAIDLMAEQKIRNGNYVLIGKRIGATSSPIVCAYRR